jgi:lysozyme
MTTGEKGIRLIKFYEKFEPHLYNDAVGNATIGYGHLVHHGPIDGTESAEFKAGITEPRACELIQSDLVDVENALNTLVIAIISQDQFDALASWLFNVGTGGFWKSTLLTELNATDYADAAKELEKWDKAEGEVLTGLLNRRKAEEQLFTNGTLPKGA